MSYLEGNELLGTALEIPSHKSEFLECSHLANISPTPTETGACLRPDKGGISPYHSFVPDDGHPLLCAVGALRNQSEVVLPHSLLSSVEGTVGAASDLEISTGRKHTT